MQNLLNTPLLQNYAFICTLNFFLYILYEVNHPHTPIKLHILYKNMKIHINPNINHELKLRTKFNKAMPKK